MDLVETARIGRAVDRHGQRFMGRIFTPGELVYCTGKKQVALHLAGRFAAKEACAKALGAGIGARIGWTDMDISHDAAGKPVMKITGKAQELSRELGVARVHLTITHTRDHAAAVVVLEG